MSVNNLWVMAGMAERDGTPGKPPAREPGKKGGPERTDRDARPSYPGLEPPKPWPEPTPRKSQGSESTNRRN